MRSPLLGEFMGTLILILMGNGVVAGMFLKRSKAEGMSWFGGVAAWAFAVMSGVFTANLFGSPDAHLSPSITLAFCILHRNFGQMLPFAAAQAAGAFCGAVLVWLFYLPHWRVTDDPEVKRGIFCTAPAIRSYPSNLFSEVIATFVIILVIGSMGSKLVLSAGAAPGLKPFLVGCVIWGVGLSLGGTTGYATNPARDLGPRIAHALLPIAGKGGSDWAYSWIPVLGPLVGAAAAGWVLRVLGA